MKTLLATILGLGLFGLALAGDAPAKAAAQPAAAAKETMAANPASTGKAKLMNPADLKETAPETFKAKFETSKGNVVIAVTRAWAPNGADRFYNLVKNGYFDNVRFFRVL